MTVTAMMAESTSASPHSNDSNAAVTSLLTLSMAAETAVPIPIKSEPSQTALSSSFVSTNSPKTHRRLSSIGRHNRRLSDAKEAAQRPSPQPSTSVGSLQVSALSLSSSPGAQPASLGSNASSVGAERKIATPIPIGNVKPGKKRGQDYKCETCSKIYRHPSCLIKHRWEHTAHWRESSKFVLSKHQQVQLLEAAAILSHLSPESATGTSLPDDRSLWPSYVSNNAASSPPQEDPTEPIPVPDARQTSVSRSVPQNNGGTKGRAGSTGPRLHDYSIPISASEGGGITQVRPGLIGVPTGGSSPVPVPGGGVGGYREHTPSESWRSSSSFAPTSGGGAWSLPRSSVRSDSGSPDDEDEDEDSVVDIEIDEPEEVAGMYYKTRSSANRVWKREDEDLYLGGLKEEDEYELEQDAEDDVKRPAQQEQEEWDGMEMDMDMD